MKFSAAILKSKKKFVIPIFKGIQMKRYIKILFVFVTVLVVTQQCSNFNLIPNTVSKKDQFVYLSEGVASRNYIIERITEKTHAYTTYDTINNYFIVDDSYKKMKISATGEVLISIPDPSSELPFKTHYVFTDSTVCDLSKNHFELEPFLKKINPSTEALKKEWMIVFEEYYRNASVVIYSNNDQIYFKTDQGWISLYLGDSNYLGGHQNSERTFKNYPAKFNSLIFLKDIASNTYSDWMSHSGSSIDKKYRNQSEEQINYSENQLKYLDNNIKKISYHKTGSSSMYAYTPIIAQFQGIGYYTLNIKDEKVRFKENAFKYPFKFFQSDAYLNQYTVPENFKNRTSISFIRYSFPTNQNESKSQGLYLLKRK